MLIIINRKKKERKTMFLSKISIHSGRMILYSMEKSIFVVVLYKLLVKKKYEKDILKTALKLMANKIL